MPTITETVRILLLGEDRASPAAGDAGRKISQTIAGINKFNKEAEGAARGGAAGMAEFTSKVGLLRAASGFILSGALVLGLRKVAGQVFELAKAGEKLEGLERASQGLAKTAGVDLSAALKDTQLAMGGTVAQSDLMLRFNQLLLLGVPLTAESFKKLSVAAKELGKAMGVDAGFALESLAVGIGRQSRLFLDNLGIIVDTEKAYVDYAAKVGKATDALSVQEQKLAFLDATMAGVDQRLKALGTGQEPVAEGSQALATGWKDFTDALAVFIGTSSAVQLALQGIAGALRDLTAITMEMEASAEEGTLKEFWAQALGLAGLTGNQPGQLVAAMSTVAAIRQAERAQRKQEFFGGGAMGGKGAGRGFDFAPGFEPIQVPVQFVPDEQDGPAFVDLQESARAASEAIAEVARQAAAFGVSADPLMDMVMALAESPEEMELFQRFTEPMIAPAEENTARLVEIYAEATETINALVDEATEHFIRGEDRKQEAAAAAAERRKQLENSIVAQSLALARAAAGRRKSIAIAETLINTAYGAARAWEYHAENPILAAVLMGLAIATGLAQVQNIRKQKFAHGGIATGGPPGMDVIPANLTRGELVVTASETAALNRGDIARTAIGPGTRAGRSGAEVHLSVNVTIPSTGPIFGSEQQFNRMIEDAVQRGIRAGSLDLERALAGAR